MSSIILQLLGLIVVINITNGQMSPKMKEFCDRIKTDDSSIAKVDDLQAKKDDCMAQTYPNKVNVDAKCWSQVYGGNIPIKGSDFYGFICKEQENNPDWQTNYGKFSSCTINELLKEQKRSSIFNLFLRESDVQAKLRVCTKKYNPCNDF